MAVTSALVDNAGRTGSSGTTSTITGAAFGTAGAGRVLVSAYLSVGFVPPSAATIGGQTAIGTPAYGTSILGLIDAVVASGTSGNIVGTFPSSSQLVSFGVVALTGAASATPTDTIENTSGGSGNIDVPAGGCLVALAASFSSAGTWTGATAVRTDSTTAPGVIASIATFDNSGGALTNRAVSYSTGDALIVLAFDASGGGGGTGVGASSGAGAAAGVGAAAKAAVGASSGVSSVAGVGRGAAAAVGSSAGAGTTTGVGQAILESVGSSSGASTVTGVGSASAAGVGTSSGVSSVSGVSAAAAAAVGQSSGAAIVVGIGSGLDTTVGTAGGASTVSGVGAATFNAVGNSAGVSTVDGVGSQSAAGTGVGNAAGASSVQGVGASIVEAIGSAAGMAQVFGISGNQPIIVYDDAGRKRKKRKPRSFDEEVARSEKLREDLIRLYRKVEPATAAVPVGVTGPRAARPAELDTYEMVSALSAIREQLNQAQQRIVAEYQAEMDRIDEEEVSMLLGL